jgi:hypothetical protein
MSQPAMDAYSAARLQRLTGSAVRDARSLGGQHGVAHYRLTLADGRTAENVLWSRGRGWLVDPAAHGGHRESDLAMLALFGAPHLGAIMAGYQETAPLADGWRARIPLHQLHPLLVHACLFGAAYTAPTLAAARAILAI